MAYTLLLAKLDSSGPPDQRLISAAPNTLPAPITELTLSVWICADPTGEFRLLLFNAGDVAQFFAIDFIPGVDLTIDSQVDAVTQGLTSSWSPSDTPVTFTLYNLLVSIDTGAQTVQVYLNDAAVPNDSIAWINAGGIFNTATHFEVFGISEAVNGIGDLWLTGSTALDFSVQSNRRKFINADLTPVDLGSDGSGPTGSAPPIFLHIPSAGSADDIATNAGTGGAWSIQEGPLAFDTNCTLVEKTAAIADLWFGQTSGFVDLRPVSARRRFIGLDGSTAYLGVLGERPFGASPPVFLSLRPTLSADHFADNDGTGGPFIISGGTLDLAGSAPSGGTFTVANDIAPNTPQGADPQVMLSVSDDGGRTFSLLQKWRSMGKIGEYKKRLRWLKLGQSRQRQIRLEITDPVRRNLIGFYLDVSAGLD